MKPCLPHMRVAFRLWFLEWILGWSRITLEFCCYCSFHRGCCRCGNNIWEIHSVFIIFSLLLAMTYTLAFRARWTDGFTRCRFHKIVISATCYRAGLLWRNQTVRWIFDACARMRVDILFGQRTQRFWCWFAIVLFRCDTLQTNEKKSCTRQMKQQCIPIERKFTQNLLDNVTAFDDADVFLSWNEDTE